MFRVNQSGWLTTLFGWLINLPVDLYWNGPVYTEYLLPTINVFGLPNFCKRYLDSEPPWLHLAEGSAFSQRFIVRPNPIDHEAVLDIPHPSAIETIKWFDAMGRYIRTEYPEQRGPSTVIHRGKLAPGSYILRVLLSDGSTFRASVICE